MSEPKQHKQVRIVGEKVIATRNGTDPLTSIPATGHYPSGAPIGQDGFSYLVRQAFSHPFEPHQSDRTGELTGGCVECGWSERIHTDPITHVACDHCEQETLATTVVVRQCDDEWEPTRIEHDGRILQLQCVVRHDRFFCSERCEAEWFDAHQPENTTHEP